VEPWWSQIGTPVLCSILKKYVHCINSKYAGKMWKYGTELLETNYPIPFHKGPDTWIVPFCWQPDGQSKLQSKLPPKMPIYVFKKLAICTLC